MSRSKSIKLAFIDPNFFPSANKSVTLQPLAPLSRRFRSALLRKNLAPLDDVNHNALKPDASKIANLIKPQSSRPSALSTLDPDASRLRKVFPRSTKALAPPKYIDQLPDLTESPPSQVTRLRLLRYSLKSKNHYEQSPQLKHKAFNSIDLDSRNSEQQQNRETLSTSVCRRLIEPKVIKKDDIFFDASNRGSRARSENFRAKVKLEFTFGKF